MGIHTNIHTATGTVALVGDALATADVLGEGRGYELPRAVQGALPEPIWNPPPINERKD